MVKFIKEDPLEYPDEFKETVMILNAFVETGVKLRDAYLKYIQTGNYATEITKLKRRTDKIYLLLIGQSVLNTTPNLKAYIIQVYDYVTNLIQRIEKLEFTKL